MEMRKKNDYLLSSVQNALRILRYFSPDEPAKGISELALSMHLGKSTVHRLMSTLAAEGFVVKDPATQKYRLSVSVLALSGVITSDLELHREAVPVLNNLVAETGETAHIGILERHEVAYLHKVECRYPVRLRSYIGKRNPAYCTSSGQVILAFQGKKAIRQVVEQGLQPLTKTTITDPDVFIAHLQHVRKQGYAVSMGELHEGIVSVGAPIWDYTGEVIASISVVGPTERMTASKIKECIIRTVKAGKQISKKLGYFGKSESI